MAISDSIVFWRRYYRNAPVAFFCLVRYIIATLLVDGTGVEEMLM